LNADLLPQDADPIQQQIARFASQFGATGETPVDLWSDLRRCGVLHPGLAFGRWAETMAVLGGLLTPVLSNSPDVATLLADLERFHPLFNQASIASQLRGDTLVVSLSAGQGGAADPDTVDACFAMIVRVLSRLAGPESAPKLVVLRRNRPSDVEDYAAVFGSVSFDGAADHCVFGPRALATTIAHADPLVRDLVRPHAVRRANQLRDDWTTAAMARMAGGDADLSQVARALSVSPRTLQVRLKAEGTTYAALAETVQRDKALALLRASDLTMTDVSGRVGFATPSALTRAVRRWTGMTPTQIRAHAVLHRADSSGRGTRPGFTIERDV
jgi:AraC-like DNA-binding protein